VQERLESAVTAAARSEAVRKRLLAIGMEPTALSGRETEQVVASDLEKWGKLIREQNIQFAQ
jgi:tripartite-type tricarboxylate transporter receptor subunit TctC